MMEVAHHYVVVGQDYINGLCEGKPAWEIVVKTATATIVIYYLKDFLWQDVSLFERGKRTFFRLARKIPAVRDKIKEEISKIELDMTKEMNENINNGDYIISLPQTGMSNEQILAETAKYTAYGKYNWKMGSSSGTVYNCNSALTDLMTKVYGMSAWTNPLHPDVFPGVRKMEAEVIKMVCTMFNGGPEACGTMTSGGTESIILACKAYRDWAINVRGIKRPEMVVPSTVHAAFDKGAALLNMNIKHVPVDPVTMKVDVAAMKRMISRRTCMIVGSAPQFPHGVIDDIEAIGALGEKYGIPVHVDACLGGFLIPFMEDAGYKLPLFDFRAAGVTSISCDTHKYGYAPKGSSVIMYKEPSWRRHQFFVTPNWPGGIYATATIAGSRSGAIVAACWASMVYHGRHGYVTYTKKILQTAKKIEESCNKIQGIFVLGKPDVSVVALGSEDFNIYQIADEMTQRGWNLNALQFPSCIHIAVTTLHTEEGVAERFCNDLQEIVAKFFKDPPKDGGGSAAIYGMAQSIPDRSLVNEIAWCYLDSVYSTEKSQEEEESSEHKLNGDVKINGKP
ncbi:unnamed protein product [Meganyctiphanes norvegica]|uniref:sphinganine-1-phosphate aldolase n=1 Tax=Meganyctiphanes norvegica TaxID=48144 RepID=A0AAV2QIW7_MEGNR